MLGQQLDLSPSDFDTNLPGFSIPGRHILTDTRVSATGTQPPLDGRHSCLSFEHCLLQLSDYSQTSRPLRLGSVALGPGRGRQRCMLEPAPGSPAQDLCEALSFLAVAKVQMRVSSSANWLHVPHPQWRQQHPVQWLRGCTREGVICLTFCNKEPIQRVFPK